MADKTPEPNKDGGEGTPEGSEPDQAEAFWGEHKTRTRGILDEWFEDKKKELREMGTSRTGGRTTLPGLLANIMFGPEKK